MKLIRRNFASSPTLSTEKGNLAKNPNETNHPKAIFTAKTPRPPSKTKAIRNFTSIPQPCFSMFLAALASWW
jgi:hypothetical protein